MNDTFKTLLFVAVAGVMVTIAAVAHLLSQPKPVEGYALVGQEFFPEFQDPNEAQSLRVLAFNADVAEIKEFNVKHRSKDGLWVIPPYNYPADAKDQLSKTASSMIGLKRGALVSRREADHEKFQVIDPLDKNSTDIKNRGQRITLNKNEDTVLADYIIGKEHASRPGYFYVRNPQEKETYLAQFQIDLSTKFSDWIESDLLQLTGSDIRDIAIKRYSIDEANSKVVESETNHLNRKSSTDSWQLEGLKENEEVEETTVSSIVSQLGDLKIVGVRPKPPGINVDLSIDQTVVRNQVTLDLLVQDLQSKGFYVIPDKDKKLKLVSNEGEIVAATSEGVVYDLYFGELFTGTDFDIEVGFTKNSQANKNDSKQDKDSEKPTPSPKEKADPEKEKAADPSTDDNSNKPKTHKSRFLFVTTQFDPQYLGEVPVKPTEPVKPKAKPESEPKPPAKPDKKPVDKKPVDKKPVDKKPVDKKPVDKKPVDKKQTTDSSNKSTESEKSDESTLNKNDNSAELADPSKKPEDKDSKTESPEEKAFKAAQDKYQSDLLKYEADKKEYDEKVKKGEDDVKKLNSRLSKWYYIISADSFENLRLARKELVKPKEKKEEETKKSPPANPFNPSGATPPPK